MLAYKAIKRPDVNDVILTPYGPAAVDAMSVNGRNISVTTLVHGTVTLERAPHGHWARYARRAVVMVREVDGAPYGIDCDRCGPDAGAVHADIEEAAKSVRGHRRWHAVEDMHAAHAAS